MPPYFFGTLLGGVLAGFVCKYLVMPSVPDYYENLVEMYREDISRNLSLMSAKTTRDRDDLTLRSKKSNYLPIPEELSENETT